MVWVVLFCFFAFIFFTFSYSPSGGYPFPGAVRGDFKKGKRLKKTPVHKYCKRCGNHHNHKYILDFMASFNECFQCDCVFNILYRFSFCGVFRHSFFSLTHLGLSISLSRLYKYFPIQSSLSVPWYLAGLAGLVKFYRFNQLEYQMIYQLVYSVNTDINQLVYQLIYQVIYQLV